MAIFSFAILLVFCAAGFCAIFFTSFGTLIILIGSVIYAAMTGFSILGTKPLLLLLALYAVGEILENLLVILGAKKLGKASNLSIAGAVIGGIVGAAFGTALFGVGIIPGTFLGIFIGGFLGEFILKRDVVRSLKAGGGSALGRLGSIAAKVLIALGLFAVIALNISNSL